MKINDITIKNIKGIKNKKIKLNLDPFMPYLLVAPNGSGKSSLAVALKSLNKNRINLSKENFHENNENLTPFIEINISNNGIKSLQADNIKNEIFNELNIEVISSFIVPKANYRKINGNPITSPSLEIENLYITENIPIKVNINYSISAYRKSIKDNRQIWINIEDLLNNQNFIKELFELDVIDNLVKTTQMKELNKFKDFVIKNSEDNKSIINSLISELNLNPINNDIINKSLSLINKYKNNNCIPENLLILIQIVDLYSHNKRLYNEYFKYILYQCKKDNVLKIFDSLEVTWKNMKPKEINILKNKVVNHKNFGIEFPKANEISNGERDVICFIGALLKAEYNFKNKPTILIIDEIFDYLDDANLIIVQYYISKFIKIYNTKNIDFFPIILTHLNPFYFKNYNFQNQKIIYWNKWKSYINREIEDIIISRNNTKNKNYEDKISEYFLHFNPKNILYKEEIEKEVKDQKLNNTLKECYNSKVFKETIKTSFDDYISGKNNYDPLSVCIALRISIEEKIYNLIPIDIKEEFLSTRKTLNKLNFAKNNSDIVIPETYYLLSTLYNEVIHIRKNYDNSSPIYLKLNNKMIREMVKNI